MTASCVVMTLTPFLSLDVLEFFDHFEEETVCHLQQRDLPCDINDVQSKIYDKQDDMLKIHERLIEGDVLLLVADVRWGGLNHHVQHFVERLNPFPNSASEKHPLLKNKVAGVVVVGDSPFSVAGQLMAALNASGFAFPCCGYVAWSMPRLAPKEAVRQAYDKSQAVKTDISLVASDLIRFSNMLKGVA